MPTAIEKLNPSRLDPEDQLLQDDTNVDRMRIFIRGKQQAEIQQVILGGTVERTVDGASTVKVDVLDTYRELQTSGVLTTDTDVNIDGLYFRLAQIERNGDTLTLTFEDREVSLLRDHNGFRKASRDSMTRAEFAESLVREEKRVRIRFFSPEEHKTQPVAPDPNATDQNRGPGFADGATVNIKGVNATPAQRRNIAIIINVGLAMGAPEVAICAALDAAAVESSAMNLAGGDRDSVGIFQQRNIPPWNKRNRRKVDQAATTFYEQAIAYLQIAAHRGEHVGIPGLAQAVQHSAFPERYRQWANEAQRNFDLFTGGDVSATGSGNIFLDSSGGAGVYEFTRGTIDDQGRVQKENTWDCLNRLAQEVNWRCFMVNGTVYFCSETYLFKSRPRLTIDTNESGIDQVDFEYDRQKKNSRVTVECHISRWGAPPGSVVLIQDHGPIDGRWLVSDINRDLFDTKAEIQLIKPLPKLPEPPAPQGQTGTPDALLTGPTSSTRQAIVQTAQRVLAKADEYFYRQYRPMAQSIFDQFAKTHTDCSAFVTLCYKAAGAPDPNGFSYNGQGYTGTLWNHGNLVPEAQARPGDLVFYGSSQGHRSRGAFTRHVAIFIGNGQTIEFGSTHPNKGTVHEASDFLGIRSYLD
jgi:hypothetical protein